MVDEMEALRSRLTAFVDENFRVVTPGIAILVKGRGFDFLYWNGSIDKLNFSYDRGTLFDLASLTKPVVTATLTLKMVELGKLSLEDSLESVGLYKAGTEAARLTIRELITHTSGLIPTYPLYNYGKSKQDYIRTIGLMHERRLMPITEEYSDLNYILLGFVLEQLSGKPLDELARDLIFSPLSMKNTSFNPEVSKEEIAPTEEDPERGGLVWGKVHDEKAFYLGGVAGHAGLFSNIDDLGKYMDAFLSGKIVSRSTLKTMISPQNLAIGGMFGLGWMIKTPRPAVPSPAYGYSAFMGELSPYGTFGHTGFTGTSICADPLSGIYSIILANRVYPSRENNAILRFRRLFHNMVFSGALQEQIK